MKKIITFGLIIFIITGCNKNKENLVIDVDNPAKISFYDMFSGIEIIALETVDSSVFSRRALEKFMFHNGNLYIMDQTNHVLHIFDEATGKFIRNFDRLGRGQGEYLNLEDFNFNRFTGNLEILTHSNILAYDVTTHKFIETYPIPVPPKHAVNYFANLGENTDIFYSLSEPYRVTIFSRKEKKILKEYFEVFNNALDRTMLIPSITPFYLYNDTTKYTQYHNGDIISINPNTYEEIITQRWNFGERALKLSDVSSGGNLSGKEKLHYLLGLTMDYATYFVVNGETDRYQIAVFLYSKDESGLRNMLLFNEKKTGKNYVFKKFKENFTLYPDVITEEAIYTCVTYSKIPDYVNVDLLTEENRAKLSNLTEDDNDVIIKYVFKK